MTNLLDTKIVVHIPHYNREGKRTHSTRKEIWQWELTQMLIDQIIDTGPEHLDMGHWMETQDVGREGTEAHDTWSYRYISLEDMPTALKQLQNGKPIIKTCGTTVCHAGHQMSLAFQLGLTEQMETSNALYSVFPAREALCHLFGVDTDSFSCQYTDWPSTMRTAFYAAKQMGQDEQAATWSALIVYLTEVRGQQYNRTGGGYMNSWNGRIEVDAYNDDSEYNDGE